MAPKIITLDEPEGSLDPRHRKNLVELLKTLPQTLVIATCNMNFAAALAERVVLVDDGRIIADGDPKKIMWDSRLMAEHGLEVPGVPCSRVGAPAGAFALLQPHSYRLCLVWKKVGLVKQAYHR